MTAQRQNKSVASYFWVGSDVEIKGQYPDIVKFYSNYVPFSSRVETVVQWMKERQPDFLMLYADQPDHQAHTSGPFTPDVDQQVCLSYHMYRLKKFVFLSYKAHKVKANLRFLWRLADRWLSPAPGQDVSLSLKTSWVKLAP